MRTRSPRSKADTPLKSLLSGGDRRSVARSERARALVEADPRRVSELAALAEDGDWLVSMGAMDQLEKLAHAHADWVQPHKRLFIGPLAGRSTASQPSRAMTLRSCGSYCVAWRASSAPEARRSRHARGTFGDASAIRRMLALPVYFRSRVARSSASARQTSTVVKTPTSFSFCTTKAEPSFCSAMVVTTSSSGVSGFTA